MTARLLAGCSRVAVVVADITFGAGLFQLVAPDARAGDPAPHSAIAGIPYHGRGPVALMPPAGSWAVAPIYRDGEGMHSYEETFRGTLRARDLNGEPHTLIVLRRCLGERPAAPRRSLRGHPRRRRRAAGVHRGVGRRIARLRISKRDPLQRRLKHRPTTRLPHVSSLTRSPPPPLTAPPLSPPPTPG